MRRILIFGNAGVGKTTLARAFSEQVGVEFLELDDVLWEQRRVKRHSIEQSHALIDAYLAGKASWIVEGLHASLLAHLVPLATEAHFLNLPFELARQRGESRPWDPKKSASLEEHKQLFRLYFDWFRSYDTRTDETSRSAHQALFDAFQGTKVEYRS
jgi:adenylate kinase family enzyme